MASKTIKELKDVITADINYCKSSMKQLEGDKNPQVTAIYNNLKTRLETLEDVLYYCNTGSKSMFYKEEK